MQLKNLLSAWKQKHNCVVFVCSSVEKQLTWRRTEGANDFGFGFGCFVLGGHTKQIWNNNSRREHRCTSFWSVNLTVEFWSFSIFDELSLQSHFKIGPSAQPFVQFMTGTFLWLIRRGSVNKLCLQVIAWTFTDHRAGLLLPQDGNKLCRLSSQSNHMLRWVVFHARSRYCLSGGHHSYVSHHARNKLHSHTPLGY